MNARVTLATAMRVLDQVRHDRRTAALLFVVPSLLVGLVAWLFSDLGGFQQIGPAMLALFPFVVMFLIASITTLRERRSGTLERLLSMPLNKLDFILGYALAFSLLAALQTAIAVTFAIVVCGLEVTGSLGLLYLMAILAAVLGTTLGLFASAFAATEFQVVQFMPAFVFPQLLLGGLFMPRERMPQPLQLLSDYLPLSHAIEAVNGAVAGDDLGRAAFHMAVVVAFSLAAVLLGALTLRRRTP